MTPNEQLHEAREVLSILRSAYKEHAQGRAATRRYKIKDREMEFNSLADLLTQIKYWQKEVNRLEADLGLRTERSGKIICRFG